MQIFRGRLPDACSGPCALTIGNFDGVHRGHQAMLALLTHEARQRGLPSCVVSFEPHPRDHFARRLSRPELAPARISGLRDTCAALEECGVDRLVVLRFNEALASLSPEDFVQRILVDQLRAGLVMVGDDFRFGAKRAGDYALLDQLGGALGFDVARMMSFEVHGARVSSSLVRQALADGDMARTQTLLGRPYTVSGRTLHGRKLGRELGFRTLNLRFAHPRPAAMGIFVVQVHGLADRPIPGVASLGVRPTIEDQGRVLLETHCLDWPDTLGMEGGYGRLIRVDLLHKLHDERRYADLEALQQGIQQDVRDAQAWWTQRSPLTR
jgi:riboflavin kinase / FMN adenylyltransferase